jgi:hypothetical protein
MFQKTRLIAFFLVFILSISPSIGIVTAATSVPLPGALVLASGENGDGHSITNELGQYLIDQGLGTGAYNMSASYEGYISKDLYQISVQAGAETPNVNFLLLRSGGISGKVTDAVSGQGLKEVMIIVSSKTGVGFGSYGVTDSDGNYKIITNLATGTYNVTAAFPKGYLSKEVTGVSVTAGVETKNVDLALVKSGVITGKVTSAAGGQPLEGITVIAMSGRGIDSMGFAQTDAGGNYRIDSGLETGTYNVTTSFPVGYLSKEVAGVSVTAGVETKNVDLALVKSGVITGTITSGEDGQPLKGINVIAVGEGMGSAQTDVNGNYRIESGLDTGTYTVTAMSGMSVDSVSDVNVTAGEETADVNLTLTVTSTPSGVIRGRVIDVNNEGIPGVDVSASGDAGSGSEVTDGDGYYEISDGLGTGTYTVSVTRSGYVGGELTDVSVTVGSVTSDVNFQLESLPAEQSGKISGTVMGESNPLVGKKQTTISCTVDKQTIKVGESIKASGAINPVVSGATVSLTFKKDSASVSVTATTGSDGKYSGTYSPASAGSWSVAASWPGDTVYNGAVSQSAIFTVGIDWTGTWNTTFGVEGPVLTQNGDVVNGTFGAFNEGRIDGTVSGNKLTGTWSYPPSDDSGYFEFTMSADGNSFTGKYWRESPDDFTDWSGKRVLLALSTITCVVSSATIKVGESVSATGAVSPAVGGAAVTLLYKVGSTEVSRQATTGTDGKYSDSYSPSAAGSWTVTASWVGNAQYSGAASPSAAFTVSQAPSTGGLKVTVLDSGAKPIVGASVSSTATPGGQSALSGVTGSDGSVTFADAAPGSYTMQVSMSGYVTNTGTTSVVAGSTASTSITLQAAQSSTGGGIPGYPVEALVMGIVISAAILMMLRRRASTFRHF